MIDVAKLRGLIAERGFSQSEVAEKLGIAPKTFYNKMKNGVFLSSEVDTMISILKPDSPMKIFFANHVAQ